MDILRALLGNPDARRRLAGTIAVVFVLLFLVYAAYWRSNAAYGVDYRVGAVGVVSPQLSDIGHAYAGPILYMPAAALAAVVHYHGGAVLYTLAMAPVPPVASALARATFGPWSDIKEATFLGDALPTLVGLGLAVGAVVVVVGSVFRRWRPPGERSLLERFFGSSEDRYRALAVIVIVAVLSVPFTFWLYAAYPTYQPFSYSVFGAPIAALVYLYWRGIVLAWLSNAVVFLGHTTAIAFIAASPDYVADPGFLVPGVMTATALGSLGACAAVVFRELYAVASHCIKKAL
ncbi:hypothetical protein [Halorubrum lacusprofundi]|jgi:hypothetical protein|uniref:Uncharacterized protein n=1 Tax=Halorubrum lacusprofundi (strain ATCC 49239 / DSM 5036 / JCM 8891 / ACAM 34) TaxID=416348 RepID=B9LU54_HALLT|nr:hypothetical protein [Halorubrum lacusprofundi]ACM58248.1 hypothetical protein Hlac_2677 [Halorubrum lacusprofundi ATCC 49239]MCG1006331.1 hypothetical protein [Halorubrum lacusprofundi]